MFFKDFLWFVYNHTVLSNVHECKKKPWQGFTFLIIVGSMERLWEKLSWFNYSFQKDLLRFCRIRKEWWFSLTHEEPWENNRVQITIQEMLKKLHLISITNIFQDISYSLKCGKENRTIKQNLLSSIKIIHSPVPNIQI